MVCVTGDVPQSIDGFRPEESRTPPAEPGSGWSVLGCVGRQARGASSFEFARVDLRVVTVNVGVRRTGRILRYVFAHALALHSG